MKRIFGSCILFVMAVAATQNIALAQQTPGLEGTWFADVTPVDCQSGAVIPNVSPFRGLYLFGHDGSLTNEAAFLTSSPRRSSGLGAWRHAQAQTYTGAFRFFRYNADGSFAAIRRVSTTILLNGNLFTSFDQFQDFDANNNPLPVTGCNVVTATRVQ